MRRALAGSSVLTTTGEHEYTRWGFAQLIEAGVGLLQPDGASLRLHGGFMCLA
mgnify:CR=1 FL=1